MKRRWIAAAVTAALLGAAVREAGVRGLIIESLLPPLYAWEYLHRALDPRQPPSPKPSIRDPRPLREQAEAMREALEKEFLIEDGKLLVLNRPDSHLGDVCLWQGVYAATAILGWRLNPSAETLKTAEAAFDGLLLLQSKGNPIIRSLYPDSLQTEPGGIQYFRENGRQWKEDASVDSTAGWMFGAAVALRFLPSRREAALGALKKYADALMANGYRLENSDGSPTRFHRVGGAWLNSPVGVLTTLTALRAMSKTKDGEKYLSEWARFRRERQDRWGAFASGPALWRNQTTNHNIAHLALSAALLLEDDLDSGGRYANGLARLERLTFHEGNSFWVYLSVWTLEDFKTRRGHLPKAAAAWLAGKENHFARARPAMFEWNYPENKTRVERLNSERSELEFVKWPFGPPVPKRPIPVWQRPAADFVWQRPARALDDWRELEDKTPLRFAPMDFLAAYRLGLTVGALSPEE